MPRAAVIVMDACGVGALPDADEYGDAGANTLGHLSERVGGLHLPTLQRLGLGSIIPIEGVPPAEHPVIHGRLHPMGPGKESTTGLRFCCNKPYSGTEVIEDYGRHHLETGEVILYTSADSVLQLAAHIDVLPEPDLYAACQAAREAMTGEHAVGRVIARPFEGEPGSFQRREGRRDYAAPPPGRSYLEELQDASLPVHGVGKIRDLFAGVGITEKHDGATNAKGIASTTRLVEELDAGLIFVNLVETDEVYGHRHDVEGFHRALREIDAAVAGWLHLLRDDDLLVLTADHGVDPNVDHTDHTREYAPLLARFSGQDGRRHDGPLSDVGASVLRWLTGRDAEGLPGEAFARR